MFHLQKTATVSKYSLFACVCLWNQGLKNEYDRNVNNFLYLQLIVCGTCLCDMQEKVNVHTLLKYFSCLKLRYR